MGKYYSRNIENEFWTGVQNSNAANRFGVTGRNISQLYYYFGNGNLAKVRSELTVIERQLGSNRTKMDAFFQSNDSYTEEVLAKYLSLSVVEVRQLLKHYADYQLGKKIRDYILKNGYCELTAEY